MTGLRNVRGYQLYSHIITSQDARISSKWQEKKSKNLSFTSFFIPISSSTTRGDITGELSCLISPSAHFRSCPDYHRAISIRNWPAERRKEDGKKKEKKNLTCTKKLSFRLISQTIIILGNNLSLFTFFFNVIVCKRSSLFRSFSPISKPTFNSDRFTFEETSKTTFLTT